MAEFYDGEIIFRDIVFLYVITHLRDRAEFGAQPLIIIGQGRKDGLINAFIKEINNPALAEEITSFSGLTRIAKRWRKLGMFSNAKRYKVTQKADKFFNQIGLDWQQWPEVIPIKDNKLVYQAAIYPRRYE